MYGVTRRLKKDNKVKSLKGKYYLPTYNGVAEVYKELVSSDLETPGEFPSHISLEGDRIRQAVHSPRGA